MNRIAIACLMGAMSCVARSAPSAAIEIQTEDVTRFYRIYEAARAHPSAEQLQHDYIDLGTAGLRHLTPVRNVTGEGIARAIAARPGLYTNAKSCLGCTSARTRACTVHKFGHAATSYS
jgi:hypothetical protein